MRAKKHFGQHFLTNADTARRIAEALGPIGDRQVLEIGPGTGVLTQFLQNAGSLKVVEIDSEAAAHVRDRWPDLVIVEADFLKVDLHTIFQGRYSVIGNFPYNISSQIVFRLIEDAERIDGWVGMFQLEMGERLIASPGNKQYGILSVLLPFYYELKKVMVLPPGAFHPPPKVKSIVLKADARNYPMRCEASMLHRVVKTAFNQRRKVLSNSLKGILSKEVLNKSQFANLRPENLTYQDFEELTLYVQEHVADRDN